MTIDENGKKKAEWSKRVVIDITPKALARLRKRKQSHVQVNYQWYLIRIRKDEKPVATKVLSEDGKVLGKRELKKILRMM